MPGSHSHEIYRHGDAEAPPPFWYPPAKRGAEQECGNCAGSGGVDKAGERQLCRICAGRGQYRPLINTCARTGCCDEACFLHRYKTSRGVSRSEYLCEGHAMRILSEKLAAPSLEKHRNPGRQEFGLVDIEREAERERALDERWAARLGATNEDTGSEGRAAEVLQLPAGRGMEGA
ncbi:hypothetical protein IT575_12050 [bacterium]|nr:hypothetical protein [bacterium]